MEQKHWALKGLFGRVTENMTAIQPAPQLDFEVGHNQYWGTKLQLSAEYWHGLSLQCLQWAVGGIRST